MAGDLLQRDTLPKMATSTALARTVPRRIAITSVLALALVAAMAVATFAVKDHIAHRQLVYNDVQASVHDLRALAHRTALFATKVRNDPDERPDIHVERQLLAELHEMARVHRKLLAGATTAELPEPARHAYGAAPRHVDRAVEAHIATLTATRSGDPAAVQRAIDDASGSLVYALDRLVRTYRSAEAGEMGRLRRIESALIGATLALLLIEFVFVFRPMARRVRDGFDELIALHDAYRRQSQEDELTGLGNRKALLLRLHPPPQRPLALLQIDLDNFRTVNETLGHVMGDRVLLAVAGALRDELAGDELPVRLGGDAFAVLTPRAVTPEAAGRLAERLLVAIEEASPAAARRVGLGASIGIATFPLGDPDPAHLLANADIALDHAKAEGRQRWRLFEPSLRAPLEERQAVEIALREGLQRDEVILHYQPQIDLRTGRVIGLEALARWQLPGGEVLGADRFIPHVEGGPLIVEVGRRVLDLAIALQQDLRSAGIDVGPIAVNVADLQLRQPDFGQGLLDHLRAAGLPPDAIAVEVVERAFVAHGQTRISEQLHILARAGVAVELDDFGTGHASLTHLKTFPVSRIKIDRSFVDGVGHDPGDETIVRATIDIARSMGRRVIAEGIETDAQRRFLLAHGCTAGQGYLISPPLPPQRLLEWLHAREAHSFASSDARTAPPASRASGSATLAACARN